MGKIKPIGQRRTTLAEAAYQRISDALLDNAILPGARLVMDELAEQLDISRTPVRDALLRLEREGMIEAAGRRGYVVRELQSADSLHLYQARESIECYAASVAAGLGDSAHKYIRGVIKSVADTDLTDVHMTYDANLRVHRAFVEVLGNPVLLELFDAVWKGARGMSMFAHYVAHDQHRNPIAKGHEPLVAALRKGPDAAFEAMRKHIRAGLGVHAG